MFDLPSLISSNNCPITGSFSCNSDGIVPYSSKLPSIDVSALSVFSNFIIVTYIYGKTGCGKTRSIYEKHGAKNICRITNYKGSRGINFDSYSSLHDVLVFEEFHSQVPIGDMLNYLDIYPIMLPCRYNDKVACYTKVYIFYHRYKLL